MKEYIVEFGDALYNEETGEAVFKPKIEGELIRCKDCVCWDTSWKPTRAIEGAYWCSNNDIYMESDDYCSLAERKES